MYFGSVRFFKHLFLTILVLLIVVPTTLCGVFAAQKRDLREDMTQLKQTVSSQQAALQEYLDAEEEKPAADAGVTNPNTPDVPAYQTLYPELYCPAPPAEVTATANCAYLTFDDGPSAVTDTVLDVLSSKGAKGTFFVVGNALGSEENQARLRRIVADGHTLAIHTQCHEYNTIYESVEAYLEDFYTAWTKVRDITGVEASIFRFPGGSINAYNRGIYQDIISEMTRRGFTYYDWNVSSQDAAGSNVAVSTILANATDTKKYSRVIVLMHDSGSKSTTAQALPNIIDTLVSKGFSLQPLDNTVKPIIFGYKDK